MTWRSRLNKRRLGAEYENRAADYLVGQGYRIVEKNYRNRFGEIDLIAMDTENTLAYCEIKYRGGDSAGDPLEAVDRKKQRRISRTAEYHYAYYGYEAGLPCRFDVIGIYADGSIRHIKDAFEFIR